MVNRQTVVKKSISRNQLIDEVLSDLGNLLTRDELAEVLDSLENVCLSHLKEATIEKPVIIKPMQGLQLQSKLLPEKQVSSFGGTSCVRTERYKVNAKFTRYFKRCVMNHLGY